MVFSILQFGNHVKEFGSNFQSTMYGSFLSESNLKCVGILSDNVLAVA